MTGKKRRPAGRCRAIHVCMVILPRKEPPQGLPEGDRAATGPDRQWLRSGYFPAARSTSRGSRVRKRALSSAKQNNQAVAILHCRCGPALALRVQVQAARRLRRHEGRDGAAVTEKENHHGRPR